MGSWLQAVAGSVFVYQLTGSSFAVGVFNFAGYLPILLFSVWGGRISDRYDRRRIVVVTHGLSFAITAVLAALTIAGQAGQLTLIVATFLVNVLWAFGKPALQALIPSIVPREELRDAVAMSSMGFQVGQVGGPLLAAAALALAGPGFAFALNAVTYLGPMAAMAVLYRLSQGARRPDAGGTVGAAGEPPRVTAGTWIGGNRWVVGCLAGVVITTMAMEIQRSLAPALIVDHLGQAESIVGLVITGQSVGGLIGFLLFIKIRRAGWSERAALVGLLLQAAGVALVALAVDLLSVTAGFSLIGLGFSLCFPVVTAALQVGTPDRLRGQIMAFHQMAMLGHRPVTAVLLGTAATALGLQAGLGVWLLLAPAGLFAVWSASRHLEKAGAPRA